MATTGMTATGRTRWREAREQRMPAPTLTLTRDGGEVVLYFALPKGWSLAAAGQQELALVFAGGQARVPDGTTGFCVKPTSGFVFLDADDAELVRLQLLDVIFERAELVGARR